MTWLNPLAFAGLLALAVPVLVHLFGRRVARRQRFPSLRLLHLVSITPTTKSQPSDILLLAVRCGVIAAAALALAQPRWSTAERRRENQSPVRAVIVDTSASMRRLTSDGRPVLAHALEMGQALLDSARAGMVVQTSRPGENIAAAASWLDTRSGMREVVVISDFQRGAVSDGDLAAVRPGVGVDFRKITSATQADSTIVGDSALAVRVDPATDDIEATWRRVESDSAIISVTALTTPADADLARASVAAAERLYPRRAPGHVIGVVFPGYSGATTLAGQLEPLRQAWQGDFLLALTRHQLFRVNTGSIDLRPCAHDGAVPLRNGNSAIVAALGSGPPGSRHELLIFSCVGAGTVAGTALLAATMDASRLDTRFDEMEPTSMPDETLRQWERPPLNVGPRGRDDTSPDGRWLWLLALLLLGAEEGLRRAKPRPAGATVQERGERVA